MSVKTIGKLSSILGVIAGLTFLILSIVGPGFPLKSIMYIVSSIIAYLGFEYSERSKTLSNTFLLLGIIFTISSIPIALVSNILIGTTAIIMIIRNFK